MEGNPMRRDDLIPIGSPRPAAARRPGRLAATRRVSAPAEARVTRIVVDEKRSSAYDGESFGRTGTYERIIGRVTGELDPRDRRNAVISDLDLAPRNERGMVEYLATFTLWQPTDPAKASGVLIDAVPNRGNRLFFPAFHVGDEPGDGFFFRRGDAILMSGWQGDVVAAVRRDDQRPGGEERRRFQHHRPGARTFRRHAGRYKDALTPVGELRRSISIPGGRPSCAGPPRTAPSSRSHPAIGRSPTAARFRSPARPTRAPVGERRVRPGQPVRTGLHREGPAGARHRAGGDTRRGVVLSVCEQDRRRHGSADPGKVSHVVAQGISQAGNFVRTFLHLGFNEDESGRIVWDGANAHIAARQLPINFRFARPGGAAGMFEPGSEGVLWWGDYEDRARGLRSPGLLARCRASGTVPKVFETFGSAEFWGLRMSPNLVGTAADRDIPLPPTVRRYYFPGTTHGGGRGGFSTRVKASERFELADNPNPQIETMRALLVALIDWVVNDTEPPPSRYPLFSAGQLVRPDYRAMGFPATPGSPLPDNLLSRFLDYDFGPDFRAADLSGRMTLQPPVVRPIIPSLVPNEGPGSDLGPKQA